MEEPIIIQCGNRRSVINGNTLQLQRLCNKRKPASIWPATKIEDESERLNAAMLWPAKGAIDLPEIQSARRHWQA